MNNDPLLTTLLDLDAALNWDQKLIIGGGYGLFLKQKYLINQQLRTFLPLEDLPEARTTKDIDLILRADIVTHSESMRKIRLALDQIGFEAVKTAKYTQFARHMGPGMVKIDLLSAPLGDNPKGVTQTSWRIKPRPAVGLHAGKLEEALGVERDPFLIPLNGNLTSGESHRMEIFIPQAFCYLLMKLFAFRDRLNDSDKDMGRHHALDIFRIVGMLTEDEEIEAISLGTEFQNHPVLKEGREIANMFFLPSDGLGNLRIREHPLFVKGLDLSRFTNELQIMLGSGN